MKLNKSVLILVFLLVAVTPVHAGLFDFLNPFQNSIDTTELDECIEIYGETECYSSFCNGNGKGDKLYCNYDMDVNRLYESELYPMTCDAVNEWNDTEEVSFIFGVNVDSQDHSLNRQICGADNNFEQFSKRDSYKVPYQLLNSVESYGTLWVDIFGAVYLEKPSKSDLEDIYGNILPEYIGQINPYNVETELQYLYDNLEELPMNDQMFSLLKCEMDCDYQGAGDNDINQPISTDGKKGGVKLDYTKNTLFLENAEISRWSEKPDLTMEESCSFWENLFSGYECSNNFVENINLQNYYKTIDRLESDVDYNYAYSNTNNALNSYTCNYPKAIYSDTEVTTRVKCTLGKTWEALFFSPDEDWFKWSTIGNNNCLESDPTCTFNMDLTFYLNSTSGNINYVDSSYEDTNQTYAESVDDFTDKYSDLLTTLINYGDTEEFTTEFVDERVTFQTELKIVLDNILELNTFIFSFVLLIAYFVEVFIFIGLFRLIVGSFGAIRKAFKELFGIKGGKE
jgi:hypothetical protein